MTGLMDETSEGTAFRHRVWAVLEPQLSERPTLEDYLQAVVDAAPGLLGGGVSASLSVLVHEFPMTLVSSDLTAWAADQVEYDMLVGPCVEALRSGQEFACHDLRREQRWPAWAAVAAAMGFGSAAGVPAMLTDEYRVAFNLYSPEVGFFDDAKVADARLFAEETVRTVRVAQRLSAARNLTRDLQEALASRSTIDQALGILMGQNRCTRDEAFGMLRRSSQNRNVKLRDVAASIIHQVTGRPVAAPPPFRLPSRVAGSDGSRGSDPRRDAGPVQA